MELGGAIGALAEALHERGKLGEGQAEERLWLRLLAHRLLFCST